VEQAGFIARVEDLPGGVEALAVVAGLGQAAALNRLAMAADIALIHISERSRSLEEAFFELTGSHSRDATSTHSLGGVR
jgi:hypothetical protein